MINTEAPAPRPLPQSLAIAVRSGDRRLAEHLPHAPWSAAGLRDRAAELVARARPDPAARRLAEDLRQEMAARGADPAGLQAAKSLAEPETLTVVALLPGTPLLGTVGDVLGALGAIALAREAAAALERACVPLICVAPAGADGGSIYLLDRAGGLRRLAAPPGAGRREARALLGAAETLSGLRWPLARESMPDQDRAIFREWNARLATQLLSPLGAVVARLDAPALTRAFGPLYVRLLALHGTLRGVLQASGLQLRAAGFQPPVGATDDVAFFGWRLPGRQQPARLRDGLPLDPGGRPVSPPELARLGADEPERLAPDRLATYLCVGEVTRLLAVVPPEADLGMLCQAGRALPHTGHGMPVIRPRPSLTIVDAATVAFTRARGAAFDAGPETLRAIRDREQAGKGFHPVAAAGELASATERPWAAFQEVAAAAAPGLSQRMEAERDRFLARTLRLAEDVAVHQRRQGSALAAAWRRVIHGLYPLDRGQDEVLAAMTFLAGDFNRFIHRVLAEPPSPLHRFVRGA
ncbi:MAG TPA: bacillithiol biosynthesis BshC [Bacillota bacterium]|nr:bacillithiol biosynthesis BshC [Bacillota bacterium]